MLEIKGLRKSYGEKKAVDKLSLHIYPGTTNGFIGHNGAFLLISCLVLAVCDILALRRIDGSGAKRCAAL